ncbi:esterase/lipase family protein [Nocardioides nitrophenolicus]|uniref:esterase/lipase family protein n=1 Tax=Nocardioides nitrophenolicus TaxID=60489 RepID=UPI00195A2DA4|nr:alpha/beta fold hydrolase [Nocardioides nitrophenolicus]MBM7515552.1 pimeloyl-ACP methyl ester carboxylesterase [Nocardioides nitrophenolicus]
MSQVYDFHDHGAEASASGGPHRGLLLLELPRWTMEYGAGRLVDLLPGERELGAGRPVLVLPGFAADDRLTGRLRGHLARRGWAVHGWGLGRNHGLTEQIVTGLPRRFAELAERYDEPVSVVGWSFGGLLARWLAHERPDRVRQVVCLGSPWRAEGERTRATGMFERSRAKHGIVADAREIVERLRGPVPVPLTAVWSRSDGIVPWRGCTVDERDGSDGHPPAENVEVVSSHVGMVASPLVLSVVVDRLRQDPAAWQPFGWSRIGRALVAGTAS